MLAFRSSILTGLAVLAVLACDSGTEPAPTPAQVEILSGNAQIGTVATSLGVTPSVRVVSANGRPVPNVSVSFEVAEGSGSVADRTQRTDEAGVASAGTWTLGTRAGTQTLTVSLSGVAPVTLSATATAGPARNVVALSGVRQTGTVAAPVSVAPTVRVTDAYENPITGHTVSFGPAANSGTVANPIALTAADGTATAGSWTLGSKAGEQTVVATAAGLTLPPITFAAVATASQPARLALLKQPSTSAASGTPLLEQPVVQIADEFGNAVARAGVAITATAGGSRTSNHVVLSDSAGRAAFSTLTLGGTAGSYQLRFTATGLAAAEATAATVLGAGAAARLAVISGPPPTVTSGMTFSPQPTVEVRDADGNAVSAGSFAVSASLEGPGSLTGGLTANSTNGRATFSTLTYSGSGPFRLVFSSSGLQNITTGEITAIAGISTVGCSGMRAITLNHMVGQTVRRVLGTTDSPTCIAFDLTQNRHQQYLVMFENLPLSGSYDGGVFPGPASSVGPLSVSVNSGATTAATASATAAARTLPEHTAHGWDFGDGPIYEFQPEPPAGGVPEPMLLRGATRLALRAQSQVAPGDTVDVYLAGISRLGIAAGMQRAIVRLVSGELIIAEDVRLPTLRRANGNLNSPIPQAVLDSIALVYNRQPKQHGDLLFSGRHNRATEAQGNRYIAVHTIMPSDGTWGYTYSTENVFAFDYWAGTDGSTRGFAQHPLRVAQNLFMHEISHMRHWGMLERARRTHIRGNRWLVEGFAHFTERPPIAAYLLNESDPSRTGNVVLPRFSEYGGGYYRDDVPAFLHTGSNVFGGYETSSYVFDYFADQVAARGGNWRTALASLVVNAGTATETSAAITAALPEITSFAELLTRARIALYADDLDAALPRSTQFLQFQLRASRPGGNSAAADPRAAWPRITPGVAYADLRNIGNGAAYGYIIDGTAATASATIQLQLNNEANGAVSVTRLR